MNPMNLAKLRAKLPTKFNVILSEISGEDLSDGITGVMKISIYEGTTPKYIGVIKDNTIIKTYDTCYEDCVKEWFQAELIE